MKTFTVDVTWHARKTYTIEARSAYDALQIAERMAKEDDTILDSVDIEGSRVREISTKEA